MSPVLQNDINISGSLQHDFNLCLNSFQQFSVSVSLWNNLDQKFSANVFMSILFGDSFFT